MEGGDVRARPLRQLTQLRQTSTDECPTSRCSKPNTSPLSIALFKMLEIHLAALQRTLASSTGGHKQTLHVATESLTSTCFRKCDIIEVQHFGKRIVEVMQQRSPALIVLRLAEANRVVLHRLPLDQEQEFVLRLEASQQLHVDAAAHRRDDRSGLRECFEKVAPPTGQDTQTCMFKNHECKLDGRVLLDRDVTFALSICRESSQSSSDDPLCEKQAQSAAPKEPPEGRLEDPASRTSDEFTRKRHELTKELLDDHVVDLRLRVQTRFRSVTTPPLTRTSSFGAIAKLSFHVRAAAHTSSHCTGRGPRTRAVECGDQRATRHVWY